MNVLQGLKAAQVVEQTRRELIINLPISNCTNQHGTPWARYGDYRRCDPIADCKNCINDCQARVAVASEFGIVGMDAFEDSFLLAKQNKWMDIKHFTIHMSAWPFIRWLVTQKRRELTQQRAAM